jgi:hypothetical protein
MTIRTCPRCYISKPLDQFQAGKNGTVCRECRSEQHRLWRAEKRDRERREAEPDWTRILNWPAPGAR